MITLLKLKIFGNSGNDSFSGEIDFLPGMNIINTGNGFGKSLIYTGILWSLGLETYLGKFSNDSTAWSDGVLDSAKLDDGSRVKVLSSYSELTIKDRLGRLIKLTRPIKGSDVTIVSCELTHPDGVKETFNLKTSNFQNENISLSKNIFDWAGIKSEAVYSRNGNTTKLYPENLAPLFFVNQQGGWVNLFCDQVLRYGIVEVNSLAVEHVLGLSDYKLRRLGLIRYDLKNNSYRRELVDTISILEEEVKHFDTNGLAFHSKSLEKLIEDFEPFNIFNYLESAFNFSFSREISNLESQRQRIHKEMDLTEENNKQIQSNPQQDVIRKNILSLKRDLSKVVKRIEDIELKLVDDMHVLKDLNSKINTYENLQYLKKDSIGLLTTEYECPTCKQDIDPTDLRITNLSLQDVQLSLKLKKSQRSALEGQIHISRNELDELKAAHKTILGDLEQENLKFNFMDSAFSQTKKVIIKNAMTLGEVESKILRHKEKITKLQKLQEHLESTVKRIKTDLSLKDHDISKSDSATLKEFQDEIIKMFKSIRLTAFKDQNSENEYEDIKIQPDDEYRPHLLGKELRRYCSASDQSKIILAFLMAIQNIALTKKTSNHLGFSVFDEPVQQNPEEFYVSSTLSFLSENATTLKGQSIVFTNIKEQSESLISSITGYTKVPSKRFLKRQS